MSDRVLVTFADGVAHLRLNRAAQRNGLDLAMFEALVAAGDRLGGDPAVRAIVLSGEGKAFCAGLDWASFLAMGSDGPSRLLARDPARSPANLAQRACWVWREAPVPVIAALHGAVYGGGLQLALGADLRYAAPDAALSAMEVRYGLVPDMALSKTLLGLVRADVAKELVFTGRVVPAHEALGLGLVTRIADDPVAAALATAAEIAGHSPDAVRAAKRLLDAATELDVAEALALESELQLGLLGSPNQREAVQAVFGKRRPIFADPAR